MVLIMIGPNCYWALSFTGNTTNQRQRQKWGYFAFELFESSWSSEIFTENYQELANPGLIHFNGMEIYSQVQL